MVVLDGPGTEHEGFRLWYLTGAVFVVRMHVATVTEDVVASMVCEIDRLREIHADEIQACGGSRSIHDWRSVQRFPGEARQRLSKEWEKLGRSDVRSIEVALSPNPVMHGLARVMSLVIMRRAGTPVRIVEDSREILVEDDVVG